MIPDNINTDRHDDAIEDAKAELRVQHVTARTVALSSVIVTGVSVASFVFRGDGTLELPLAIIGSLAAVAAAALLILLVMLYGIGVAGAKHALDRKIRQRDRFVLKKMGESATSAE